MIDVHTRETSGIGSLLRSSKFNESSDVGNGIKFALHKHRLMKSSTGAMIYGLGVLSAATSNFLSSNPKMYSEVQYAALSALGLMAAGSCIILKQIVEGTKLSIKFHSRDSAKEELGEFDYNKTSEHSSLKGHFSLKAFARANGPVGLFGIACSSMTSGLFLGKAIYATNAHEMLNDIGGIALGALCTAAILRINSKNIEENVNRLKKDTPPSVNFSAPTPGSGVKRNKLKN